MNSSCLQIIYIYVYIYSFANYIYIYIYIGFGIEYTLMSDGETPVLELWRMWSTLTLPSLLDPLLAGVVVSIRNQTELFIHSPRIIIISYLKLYSCVQIIYIT